MRNYPRFRATKALARNHSCAVRPARSTMTVSTVPPFGCPRSSFEQALSCLDKASLAFPRRAGLHQLPQLLITLRRSIEHFDETVVAGSVGYDGRLVEDGIFCRVQRCFDNEIRARAILDMGSAIDECECFFADLQIDRPPMAAG